jgi:nondiscriminating glutamyl-tRNA synthetase
MKRIKVRFAPSPTGPLHIGGARSALFNYLFARHNNGKLVLRSEDTDLERSHQEYEEEILESLRWLGISWDEGLQVGGEDGPYRQTERLDIYNEYTARLLETGQAYYCFCTEVELEEERQEAMDSGEMPRYSGRCRHLTPEEVETRRRQGEKPAVRFKVAPNRVYIVDDLVRGRVSFDSNNIGDFIIVKSDGIPTYNFAVVIDDVLMDISHVIRAEEHLSNTPRQLMIYDALNLKRPEFAHISLILGSDRQKMSKRHGATSLIQYREKGYLPEALFNFLSLLGWAPAGEEQIFSPEEIIAAFTLERVAKSPAVFDLDKLNWINQQHIKQKSHEELKSLILPYLQQSRFSKEVAQLDKTQLDLLLEVLRDRIICLTDVNKELEEFFALPEYGNDIPEVMQADSVEQVLEGFISGLPDFQETAEIKQFIKTLTKSLQLKPKNVFMPLRYALTGKSQGPDLPYLIFVWGREETLRRARESMKVIKAE